MVDTTELINSFSQDDIRNKIYTIRGVQVMLDSDLAEIYGYTTAAFNQQVKNNSDKFFGDEFMFQLTQTEFQNLMSKNFTSSWGGRRKLPNVFTESGVYMLMTVLKGSLAVQQSRALILAFKAMRHYLMENALVFQRLDRVELKQLDTDNKVNQIFKQLENPKEAKAVLFFKGQMWDATSLIEDIIMKAREEIILIDNYVDKKTLDLLVKKKKGVTVNIYTSKLGDKLTEKEITDFTNQYGSLTVKITEEFHDRFMILDKKVLYHIGSSIKDAGKKAFEISLNEDEKILKSILERI